MITCKNCIRTKTYYLGETPDRKAKYLEKFIYPINPEIDRSRRGKKTKVSCPAQKKFNNKKAVAYFERLVKTNFDESDIHLTCTYTNKMLPADIEDAEQYVKNFIRRVNRFRASKLLDKLKYIYVTEQSSTGRIHHHMLMPGDMKRSDVENLWGAGKVNADRIQIDEEQDMDALAAYMSKDPKGKRRWHASRNLKHPETSKNDDTVSRKKYAELTMFPLDIEDAKRYFEKTNPEYNVTEVAKVWNPVTMIYTIAAKLCLKGLHGKAYTNEDTRNKSTLPLLVYSSCDD